jgi:hypothetical protein
MKSARVQNDMTKFKIFPMVQIVEIDALQMCKARTDIVEDTTSTKKQTKIMGCMEIENLSPMHQYLCKMVFLP